jgi:iron complex transport system substrate-binding protein
VDPRDLRAVEETILEIGDLLNVFANAEKLVRQMAQRTRRITDKTADASHRPTVFFQIGISPIVSAGTDTFIHELITLAGGINLAKGPVPYPRFSREQILALSPEVFIITSMARGAMFERIRTEWRRWPQIPAVKHNRIHLIDSDLVDRASPRLVEGLEILARLLHPTLFRPAP